MVPSAYDAYFTTAASAGAALIGLLFVAIALRDDTIFGRDAAPGGEALAIAAFTGLVNSFVVSLLALIPGTNIGIAAVAMAAVSLTSILRLHSRLHRAGGRSVSVQLFTVVAYVAQLGYGIVLVVRPHDTAAIPNLVYIIFAALAASLQRAWSLVRGRHLLQAPDAVVSPAAPDGGAAVAGQG
jgi:hypothetical protein